MQRDISYCLVSLLECPHHRPLCESWETERVRQHNELQSLRLPPDRPMEQVGGKATLTRLSCSVGSLWSTVTECKGESTALILTFSWVSVKNWYLTLGKLCLLGYNYRQSIRNKGFIQQVMKKWWNNFDQLQSDILETVITIKRMLSTVTKYCNNLYTMFIP